MIKRFALVFMALLLHIIVKADAIDDIIKFCKLPNSMYGITMDYCRVDKNKLTFVCHIDKKSDSYRSYLKVIGRSDSVEVKRDLEGAYEQNGGYIDTSKFSLYGTPYEETWFIYMFFKSHMVKELGKYIYNYKLADELRRKRVKIYFDVKGTGFPPYNSKRTIHIMSCDMSDFDEVATIIKHEGNLDNVIEEKYTMFRGIRLNQKTLPTQVGWGVTLDSLKIQNNTVTYYNGVSDIVANTTSMEDMKGTIRQMQLNMDAIIDKEKLKKAKGFPLLNMKMRYEWYRNSNKEKIASVTFAYPSLEILNAWPDSIKLEEPTIDYTSEEGETSNIPICLYDPVDLGVSVNWSSMNLGANKVDECGGLFGCGDITGNLRSKDSVDYYIPDTIKCIKGNPSYDIVRCIKGEWWHMPSAEEWKELLNLAIVVQTTYKGVPGYKIIGSNGCAIFLPKNGFRNGNKDFYKGSYGVYWSSDVSKMPNCNEYLYMDKDFKMIDSCPRWRGMSVRPVREY